MNCIILAGGKAKRMGGIDKASLQLGEETFLDRKARILRPLFDTIIVVSNNLKAPLAGSSASDYIVVPDKERGFGPLMGLYSGLAASSTAHNFFTTVDTPFLTIRLVKYLLKQSENKNRDGLVARWNGMIEPLFAVYSKNCLEAIEQVMEERKIISFYRYVTIEFIPEDRVALYDPQGYSFFNVNTWDDYRQATALFSTLKQD